MRKLHKFWKSLNGPGGFERIENDWKRGLGDDWVVMKRFLKPNGKVSETYLPLEIERHESAMQVAHCGKAGYAAYPDPESGLKRMPVDESELIIYEFAQKEFSDEISKALGVKPAFGDFFGRRRSWSVGACQVRKGEELPVYYIGERSDELIMQAALDILIKKIGRFILLCPGRHRCQNQLNDLAAKSGGSVFYLDEILCADEKGRLAAERNLSELVYPSGIVQPKPACPRKKRKDRAETIDSIQKALNDYIYSMKSAIKSAEDMNRVFDLPALTKKSLAATIGKRQHSVSRAFKDNSGSMIRILFEVANSEDSIRRFK